MHIVRKKDHRVNFKDFMPSKIPKKVGLELTDSSCYSPFDMQVASTKIYLNVDRGSNP